MVFRGGNISDIRNVKLFKIVNGLYKINLSTQVSVITCKNQIVFKEL